MLLKEEDFNQLEDPYTGGGGTPPRKAKEVARGVEMSVSCLVRAQGGRPKRGTVAEPAYGSGLE